MALQSTCSSMDLPLVNQCIIIKWLWWLVIPTNDLFVFIFNPRQQKRVYVCVVGGGVKATICYG